MRLTVCLLVLTSASPLSSAPLHAVAPATHRLAPFIQATGTELYCAESTFQACLEKRFVQTDLWVFGDRTATSTVSYKGIAAISGGSSTPVTVRAGTTRLSRGTLSELQSLVAGAALSATPGECNPLSSLPLIAPPSIVHYTIVYWGPGFQTNRVELSTDFDEICPIALRQLFTWIQVRSTNIAGAPLIVEPL